MDALKKKLLSGGAAAAVGRLMSAVLGFGISALLARMLPKDLVAAYFLSLSVVTFASILGQFGLNQSAIRFIARAQTHGDSRTAFSVSAVVICSGAVLALFVGGIYFVFVANYISSSAIFDTPALSSTAFIAAVWIVGLVLQGLIAEIFRGFSRIANATLYSGLLSSAISVGGLGALWLMGQSGNFSAVLLLIVGSVMISSVAGISSMFWGKTDQVRLSLVNFKEMYKTSAPILGTNIAIFILNQSAVWIVAYFCTQDDVAQYGVANRVLVVFTFLSSLLYAVLPPIIVNLHTRGEYAELEMVLRRSATINSLIVAPLVIVCCLFSSQFLSFVFGERYAGGGAVLAVLTVGAYINLLKGVCGYVLMVTGFERRLLGISAVTAVVVVALTSLGAKHFGVLGVALGVCAGNVVQCLLELVFVKRAIGIKTYMYFWPRKFDV
jgi:O-antigen/teichoic acid export membrane protein